MGLYVAGHIHEFFLCPLNFISVVEQYNHIGYRCQLYPLHVSRSKQRWHSLFRSQDRLPLMRIGAGGIP
jgi:hypothetical protein